jgi:hypothetical protein
LSSLLFLQPATAPLENIVNFSINLEPGDYGILRTNEAFPFKKVICRGRRSAPYFPDFAARRLAGQLFNLPCRNDARKFEEDIFYCRIYL